MQWGSIVKVNDDALSSAGIGGIIRLACGSPGVYVVALPLKVAELINESFNLALRGEAAAGMDLFKKAHLELVKGVERTPDASRLLETVERIYEMAPLIGEGSDRLLAEAFRAVEEYYAEALRLNSEGLGCAVISGKELGAVAVKADSALSLAYDASYQNARERLGSTQGRSLIVAVACPFDSNGRPMPPSDGWADVVAVLLASVIGAKEVLILTESPQVAEAERSIVESAEIIEKLSYPEAIEIASFYPELIGKEALVLAEAEGIRLRFSDFHGRGTVISGERSVSSRVIKCVAAKRSLGIVTVKGRDVVGLLPRLVSELTGAGIRLSTLTLSTSGTEVSLVLPNESINTCRRVIEFKLMGKGVDDYKVVKDVCAISVIGEGMRGTPGIASRLFTSVARKGINIIMIMQGSSELNIGFIIEGKNCKEAVAAVYEEFFSKTR